MNRDEPGPPLFELLLRLYPPSFVRRFGAEMRQDFLVLRGEARRAGGRAAGRLWLRTAADIIRSLPREHVAALSAHPAPLVLASAGLLLLPGLYWTGLALALLAAVLHLGRGMLLHYPAPGAGWEILILAGFPAFALAAGLLVSRGAAWRGRGQLLRLLSLLMLALAFSTAAFRR